MVTAFDNTMLLFSTPVYYHTDFHSDQIHDTTKEQTKVTKNLEGNFSSQEHNILELESYQIIKDRILQGLHEYTRTVLLVDESVEFYITQSWLNINPPDTKHHRHNHSNSIISGVYYIDAGKDSEITFCTQNTSPITSNPSFSIPVKEYNLANSGYWTCPVYNNGIIYFPSTTLHEVGPNNSNRNRISLAFNVFMRGELGTEKTLNHLKLG